MYLLQLTQDGEETILGAFESLEQGRAFISRLEGYEKIEEDGVTEECIDYETLPDYMEMEINGHILPFSKWMFSTTSAIEIEWKEVPNLSVPGRGMVDGATRIDAYSIDNADVKAYIQRREQSYALAKSYLEGKGYEVVRDFKGSEDGEAILYRRSPEEEWMFLSHLDPTFFEDQDVLKNVEELLDEE